jgi:hypothetical protein
LPILDGASVQTNITVTASDDATEPWTIAANSSTVSFNETIYMYLIPNSGGFTQIGFASNSSLPDEAVTTGWAWFGTSVAYATSESDYELMCWALETDTTGVYGLYWNAGTITNGSVPVTLKKTPPKI